MFTRTKQVPNLKSIIVVVRYSIFTLCTPLPPGGGQGGKMMNIAHPVVTMADSTSETWYKLASDTSGHHAVITISGIHVILAEISPICIWALGALGAFWVHMARTWLKTVL